MQWLETQEAAFLEIKEGDWHHLKLFETRFLAQEKQPLQGQIAIGRSFVSSDGFVILAGRNLKENLALTFQVARGNDIWLHMRGQKSAHVLILLREKKIKSCSLEALLDAAHVLLHFSGKSYAGSWDIDYTFQKYVKRIKKTDLVSYSQHKTLRVQWESNRINRLVGRET